MSSSPLTAPPSEAQVLERLVARPGPFTARDALSDRATYPMLRRFVRLGLLAHPVRGVYHAPDLPDDLALRVAVLRLVVPRDAVVTDRSAGWLWGADMILAPGAHRVTPDVTIFCPPGRRLRLGLVDSGERMLAPADVADLGGLRVTTPLRTACDLGRLLHRDQALAALDSLSRTGAFRPDDLALATTRFKGYRGVIQLRALVPIVDPGAESPGESIMRMRWYDAGLPRPACQVPVPAPYGGSYHLDLGVEQERFAAEYDGEAFHGEDQREHDEQRRDWIRNELGWTLVVLRRDNVHGHGQDAEALLREAWRIHPK